MSIVETHSYRWRMELSKRRDNSIESDIMIIFYLWVKFVLSGFYR